MEETYFRQYFFKGSHKEVGRQYGETLRNEIGGHLDRIRAMADEISGVDPEKAGETAVSYIPYIEKYAPGFMEEILGLSEGANISRAEAVLLQARQEIIYLAQYGRPAECTSYAAGPGYTDQGQCYIGQNLDLNSDFESISNVVVFAVENKPQVMMVLPAGQISNTGLNSEGIGVNCNFLFCRGWRRGFPRYLISRLLMEQRTFSGACGALQRIRERAASRNVLLADAHGNIADFEVTPEDVGVLYAEGLFVHSNHFLCEDMLKYERGDAENAALSIADSRWRKDRLYSMLSEKKGKINSDILKAALRDHKTDPQSGKFSVCMHACDETSQYRTVASMISNLTERTIEVARGLPCCHPYRKYRF